METAKLPYSEICFRRAPHRGAACAFSLWALGRASTEGAWVRLLRWAFVETFDHTTSPMKSSTPNSHFGACRAHCFKLFRGVVRSLTAATLFSLAHFSSHSTEMAQNYLASDLGRGVDPSNFTALRKQVLETNAVQFSILSQPRRDVFVRYVQSTYDYFRTVNAHVGLDVRAIGKLRATAGFNYSRSEREFENSLVFGLAYVTDFGPITFDAPFDPNFQKFLTERAHLPEDQLLAEVRRTYGTHYIRGYRPIHYLFVEYNYYFGSSEASQRIAADFQVRYRGLYGQARLDSAIEELLQRKQTNEELSAHIYSSSLFEGGFPQTEVITNITQFHEFVGKAENFGLSLTNQATALKASFVLDRIDTHRDFPLPRFKIPDLLGEPDYASFSEQYRLVRDLLGDLDYARSPGAAHWLNAKGQDYITKWRAEVINWTTAMENVASNHFTMGAPLKLPGDPFNLQASAFRVAIHPTINVVETIVEASENNQACAIGVVDFGNPEVSNPKSIKRIWAYNPRNALGLEEPVDVVYSQPELEALVVKYMPGSWGTLQDQVRAFFTNQIWLDVVEDQAKCGAGLFLYPLHDYSRDKNRRFLYRDGTGKALVEVDPSIRTEWRCQAKLEASNEADVFVVVRNPHGFVQPDTPVAFDFGVTNSGPGAAHGVRVTVPIPAGFEFDSVVGSQGQGRLIDGQVEYEIGPLAKGAGVSVVVTLFPDVRLPQGASPVATSSIEAGMVELATSNDLSVSYQFIVGQPRVGIAATPGKVIVSWQLPETPLSAEPYLEQAEAVGPSAAWQRSAAIVETNGVNRSISFAITSRTKNLFWRLAAQ
ncbi:MAG: DUF11 domain-containing protein [Chloroflexi bacterium]|nr:DUF11 domain-containing protein [Chloroflexota bacterium]